MILYFRERKDKGMQLCTQKDCDMILEYWDRGISERG